MQEPGARGLAEECEAGHTWKKFIQLERPLIGADRAYPGRRGRRVSSISYAMRDPLISQRLARADETSVAAPPAALT